MKVVPCGYRLVVKQDSLTEVDDIYKRASKSNIIIAHQEVSREQMAVDTGIVLSIGPDVWADFKQPWCEVGDRIVFAKYAGKVVGDGEDKVIVLNDEDVVAVLKD